MTEKEYFELLNKVFDGTATEGEKALVDAFYERISSVQPTTIGNRESMEKNREEIFRKLNLKSPLQKPRIGHFPKLLLGLAASISIILVGWSLVFYFSQTNSYQNMGENISMVDLPDGSQVMLSPNSNISYHKNIFDGSRVVKLQGEGFFDVRKINDSKFKVHFLDSKLEVLGTTFHIDAKKPNQYQVGLFTGSIAVFPKTTEEMVLMKPGQKLLVDPFSTKEGYQLAASLFANCTCAVTESGMKDIG